MTGNTAPLIGAVTLVMIALILIRKIVFGN